MINANELRIGNWLYGINPLSPGYNPGKIYFQVENIFGESINLYIVPGFETERAYDVEPIPITMEILEKCGFSGAWTTINGLDGNLMGVKLPELEYEIKYVHQLQNLYFALTGNELNINL